MVDPDDQMPVDWLPDVDPLVDDPDAARPDDWNDAVDGMWIAPKVSTSPCHPVTLLIDTYSHASHCGIINPNALAQPTRDA